MLSEPQHAQTQAFALFRLHAPKTALRHSIQIAGKLLCRESSAMYQVQFGPVAGKRELFFAVRRSVGAFRRWTDENGHVGHSLLVLVLVLSLFDCRDRAATRFIRQ